MRRPLVKITPLVAACGAVVCLWFATLDFALRHAFDSLREEGRPSRSDLSSPISYTDSEMTPELVRRHTILFHKYKTNLTSATRPIEYELVKASKASRPIVAHLHCLQLWEFDSIYGSILPVLQARMSLVVTYSYENESRPSLRPEDALLRVPNKGMDVGAKFCAVTYLVRRRRACDLVLFLHSKSNPRERRRFFEWFVNQVLVLPSVLDRRIGGIFSPFLLMEQRGWPGNSLYMIDLVGFFGLEDDYFWFPVGNCFYLSFEMSKVLYTDRRLYNVLNTPTSLDFGWLIQYYKPYLSKKHKQRLLNRIHRNSVALNNLHLGRGHDGHADSMIEHAFERIIFLALRGRGKIGVFDVAQKADVPALELSGPNELHVYPHGHRQPIDDTDLVARFFSTAPTKFDRVAFIDCHAGALSVYNNLFFLAEIAFEIVLFVDDAASMRLYLDSKPHRDSFIVDSELSDRQCMLYAGHLELRHLTLDELRAHYVDNQLFVPHVIARLRLIESVDTQDLPAVVRKTAELNFTDYIVAYDSVLFCRSLSDFAVSFEGEETHFDATEPPFLTRYSRAGVMKLINATSRSEVRRYRTTSILKTRNSLLQAAGYEAIPLDALRTRPPSKTTEQSPHEWRQESRTAYNESRIPTFLRSIVRLSETGEIYTTLCPFPD